METLFFCLFFAHFLLHLDYMAQHIQQLFLSEEEMFTTVILKRTERYKIDTMGHQVIGKNSIDVS